MSYDELGNAYGGYEAPPTLSPQERVAQAKADELMLRGISYYPQNLAGAPVDLANMALTPFGLGSETPVGGSKWLKEKSHEYFPKIVPKPTGEGPEILGEIATSWINPASVVRGAVKGTEKVAPHLAEKATQMYENAAEKYPGIVAPLTHNIVKPKGGNWTEDLIEHTVSTQAPGGEVGVWMNKKLPKYMRNEMGTAEDKVRLIGEQGHPVAGLDVPTFEGSDRLATNRERGGNLGVLGQSQQARDWENITDSAIKPYTLEEYKRTPRYNPEEQPWLVDAPSDSLIYNYTGNYAMDTRIRHLGDILSEELASGRMTQRELDNLQVHDAFKRMADWDVKAAKEAEKATVEAVDKLPVELSFEDGMRWVKLNDDKDLAMKVGKQLGHCYQSPSTCDRYAASNNLYSLVDSSGKPHVTTAVGRDISHMAVKSDIAIPRMDDSEISALVRDMVAPMEDYGKTYEDTFNLFFEAVKSIQTDKRAYWNLASDPGFQGFEESLEGTIQAAYKYNEIPEIRHAVQRIMKQLESEKNVISVKEATTEIRGKNNGEPDPRYQPYIDALYKLPWKP